MKNLVLALSFLVATSAHSAEKISVRMSVEEAKAFCAKWFPALVLGERELETALDELLANHYSEDFVLIDPNFAVPQVGKAAARVYYRAVLSKYPNWSFKIREILPTAKGFVLYYEGHVPGVVEKFLGADILEINAEGKISKLVGFYDRQPFIEAADESQQ